MIARPTQHCDDQSLESLLDESLTEAEASAVESHLRECDQCRMKLQQLAGDAPWWAETSEVLSTTQTEFQRSASRDEDVDQTISWLQAFLREPERQPAEQLSHQSPKRTAEEIPDESNRDLPPSLGQIDQYKIDEMIGQGGMGVVLKGNDPTLNRSVAIKVLAPHLAGVGAARSRFKREAKSAAAITHPAVVPIYAIVADGELPYLVMPLIEGGNLQQLLDREGPLPIEEVLRIGAEVAEGLTAAHARGVIHRDIKPANLLIEKGNGRVLISDFGLARALDDATVTLSGMIAGTPSYMSPEQARGETTTTASDWFSFGSLLYALSTGRPPFRAECPIAVLRKITDLEARPVHEINESMPPWVNVLISKFMNRDIDKRKQAGNEAVALLRAAHLHVTNPAIHPLPSSLNQSLLRARSLSTSRLIACVAFVFAVIVSAIGWSTLTPDKSNPTAAASEMPAPQETPLDAMSNVASDVQPSLRTPLPRNQTSWHDTQLEEAIDQLERQIANEP